MLKPRGDQRFAHEPPLRVVVAGEQLLDRDRPIEHAIFRAQHAPDATVSDLAGDLVALSGGQLGEHRRGAARRRARVGRVERQIAVRRLGRVERQIAVRRLGRVERRIAVRRTGRVERRIAVRRTSRLERRVHR